MLLIFHVVYIVIFNCTLVYNQNIIVLMLFMKILLTARIESLLFLSLLICFPFRSQNNFVK